MAAGLQARIVDSIHEVDAERWDACARGDAAAAQPFLSHAFLCALEDSGSATPKTGWAPSHVLLESDGELLACAPAYLKGHSRGEYVFDHSWAHAYGQAGGQYYPKLLVAVPFTPVTGPRLLVRAGPDAAALRLALARALQEVVRRLQISSVHITFPTNAEWDALAEAGFLQRTDQQFHWENRGYDGFEAFLADLSSRKRKQIRKERREALAPGIEVEVLTGDALTDAHWDAFFSFYMDTGARKWGTPYLTRDFFTQATRAIRDDIVLFLCRRGGRYIAGALNFQGADTLYGRYWGCIEDHPFLHFEVCYYQAIDYAIAAGLKRVEAGAQGPHKIARGYLPVETYSLHWFRDESFQDAVARYLVQERRAVEEDIEFLAEHSPFRVEQDAAEDEAAEAR